MQTNSRLIGRKNHCGRLIVVFGLLTFLVGLISCGPKKIVHNTIYNDEPEIVTLKEKYAGILDVENEKIRNIALYQNIDEWENFKDSNVDKLESLNINFIQYLYYFNRRMKLPTELNELYDARKTYLFKDCYFLEEGDLVFFTGKSKSVKEVGFYLDNNIFVAADAGGDLNFHHLRDSITEFHVISNAKIVNDVR